MKISKKQIEACRDANSYEKSLAKKYASLASFQDRFPSSDWWDKLQSYAENKDFLTLCHAVRIGNELTTAIFRAEYAPTMGKTQKDIQAYLKDFCGHDNVKQAMQGYREKANKEARTSLQKELGVTSTEDDTIDFLMTLEGQKRRDAVYELKELSIYTDSEKLGMHQHIKNFILAGYAPVQTSPRKFFIAKDGGGFPISRIVFQYAQFLVSNCKGQGLLSGLTGECSLG